MITTKNLSLATPAAVFIALGAAMAPASAAQIVNFPNSSAGAISYTGTVISGGGDAGSVPAGTVGTGSFQFPSPVVTRSVRLATVPNGTVTPAIQPVPEPSAMGGTMAFGVLGTVSMLKRQRKRLA